MGISTVLKVIDALRQVSYGLPANIVNDIFDISKTMAELCLHHFFAVIIDTLGVFYLRDPTLAEITKTEMSLRKTEFLGCIGCLDCAGST